MTSGANHFSYFSRETTDQIQCSLNNKDKSGPKWLLSEKKIWEGGQNNT